MKFQRHALGVIGLLMMILGVTLYARGSNASVMTAAMLRAGCLLSVTWLAWPQLMHYRDRIPRIALVAGILLATVLVARPSAGKIAGIAAFFVITASLLARWIKDLKRPR